MRVGILTFSDGRPFVARDVEDTNLGFQRRLAQSLEAAGFEVVAPAASITSAEAARDEALRLAAAGCQCTIFNYAVWAFPHFTAIASRFAPGALLLFSNVNPQYPGLVGMLAAAGALDQLGVTYGRAHGDIEEPAVAARVLAFVRAASCARALRGERFGLFGGRPMGMYTAVANPDQWMRQFGIDVEHIDQWEIVRRSAEVPAARAQAGRAWLERMAHVHYDGKQLTPELLERQVRAYHALRALIAEHGLDFCGVKGQPELTNEFCTMDVPEAFLNDPYDWEGPKPITVCATEADMDAALTMEIFKHLAGTPVLFADVRHYHQDRDVFDLVNSGEHATYFAAHSLDPAENMPHVHLYPEGFYFPAGGASVHHLAAPGPVTFARLARRNGVYWMAIVRGEFVRFSPEENETLMRQTTYEWPHAFARLHCPADTFLARFASNHIHAVYGDWVGELQTVCALLGIEAVLLA